MEDDIFSQYCGIVSSGDLIVITFSKQVKDAIFSASLAEAVAERINAIAAAHPGQMFNSIIDFLPLENNVDSMVSAEARKIYSRLAAHPQARRFAVIGRNFFLKFAANILFRMAGNSEKMRFFDSREKALEWFEKDSRDKPARA
jgi:hypothetical protein